jgi:thymidylate synthase
MKKIMNEGDVRQTRNSITRSIFGTQLSFDISNNTIPLLTTKRTFFKGIKEELLWFIAGNTDAKYLQEKGVHIWDGNTSREFLDNRGLSEYEEGDIGNMYGQVWRHYGAKYEGCNKDYSNQGIDQLANCINLIKTDPCSRRIYMSAWNPEILDEGVLCPCHISYQWYVSDGKLSCQMYMRSNDFFLGNPFNIASTALLTIMIAHVCNLKTGKVVISLGDTHLYEGHIYAVKKQLERIPNKPFPVIRLNSKVTDIDSFTSDDIELIGYECDKGIKAEMVA